MLWSLFGFEMGMIVACFQRWGIVFVLKAMLYMFVRYLVASGPRCLRCLMFMPSGPMELLFMLFEMDNCTCVVVSCIYSVRKVLIVWSMYLLILLCAIWSDVHELLFKSFWFVYVSDGCLVSKQMLLFCYVCVFCCIVLLWCPTGSVDCVCDQFCQDVVSSCLLCVHVFVYVIVKSNDLWV